MFVLAQLTRFKPGLAAALTSLVFAALLACAPAHGASFAWPKEFRGEQIPVTGGTQYVRVGDKGPAVLLLHGFGDTGDMWLPLAFILAIGGDHSLGAGLASELGFAASNCRRLPDNR